MKNITYTYTFTFPDGNVKEFTIEIDAKTLQLIARQHEHAAWTRLAANQCSCCPLSEGDTPYCPIAVNLADLVVAFCDTISYESCKVTCTTAERVISKDTIVQEGLSSIMGIIMATSGCPIMNILKPMARFHLPFATVDEAMFRSVSVYLLRQYFIYLDSGRSDFLLENVQPHYSKIEQVNSGILSRLKNASRKDADRNAIIILNCLAQILGMELEDNLQSLRYIFMDLN